MIRVIETCFSDQLKNGGWTAKLKEIIPSCGQSLIDHAVLCERVRTDTASVLQLHNV
jgi:malate dehydrogenase (quinone)